MNSAMDALKYSGYMSAAAGQAGLSSLYSGGSNEALKSVYGSGEAGAGEAGKTEYSAESLGRSYLEQQRAYYDSVKPGQGGYSVR